MFRSEKEMSVLFEEYLSERNNRYLLEYRSSFGIPDFLIFFPKRKKVLTISIELKLFKWKGAINQAFRYKNYSDVSYVIIDEHYVHRALKNISYFKKFNVGLASFNKEKELKICFTPELSSPFCNRSYDEVRFMSKDVKFEHKPKLKLV